MPTPFESYDEWVRRLQMLRGGDPQSRRADWLAQTRASLPAKLPKGEPEVALVLAQLALFVLRPSDPLPIWADEAHPAEVQLAWIRAEISLCPQNLERYIGSPLLPLSIQSLRAHPSEIQDPLGLSKVLAGSTEDLRLQREALPIAKQAMIQGTIPPEEMHALLLSLLHSPHATVVIEALEELAQPYALCFPYPKEALLALETVNAAGDWHRAHRAHLRLAAASGLDGPLRQSLTNLALPLDLRAEALGLLGEVGRRGDLLELLALVQDEPLSLGKAALRFLRLRHRRGHFLSPEHLPLVLHIYLQNQQIRPEDLVPLLYTVRRDLLRHLQSLSPSDPGWERLVPLLSALGREDPALQDEVGSLLQTLLEEAHPKTASDNPALQELLLEALASLPHLPAEAQILALLPQLPGPALSALRRLGGSATAEALFAACQATPLPAWLLPHLKTALVLIWHLAEGPQADPLREKLLSLLSSEVPEEIRADLGSRVNPAEEKLLRRWEFRRSLSLSDEPSAPAAALATVAQSLQVAEAEELLLRCISSLCQSPKSPEQGHAELPEFPPQALSGLRELGATLHRRRRLRPVCLLAARDPQHAGNLLLGDLLCRLLARPDLIDAEQIYILHLLQKEVPPDAMPPIMGHLRRLLRHPNVHLRKKVIACMARRDLEKMAHNLSRLVANPKEEIHTLREALDALGALRATFAAPAIAACLEHPNMNLKKTAAEALAKAGTPRIVQRLLFWLGYHDNPGFRELLLTALGAILGDAKQATLRAAVRCAKSKREEMLLTQALFEPPQSQGIPASARAQQQQAPRPAFVDLSQHGWSEARGRAVLGLFVVPSAPPLTEGERQIGRPYLTEWLSLGESAVPFCGTLLAPTLRPVEVPILAGRLDLLLLVLAQGGESTPALLDLLTQLAPHLPPSAARRIVTVYRSLPVFQNLQGSPPFGLLRACRAVLLEEDLRRALAECRRTADPQAQMRAVLAEAFPAAVDQGGKPKRRGASGNEVHPGKTLNDLLLAYPMEAPAQQEALLTQILAQQDPFVPRYEAPALPRRRGRTQDEKTLEQKQTLWLEQLRQETDPAGRLEVAQKLLTLPSVQAKDAVLIAYLEGDRPEQPLSEKLAPPMLEMLATRLAAWPPARHVPYRSGPALVRWLLLLLEVPRSLVPRFVEWVLSILLDSGAGAAPGMEERCTTLSQNVLLRLPAEELLAHLYPHLNHQHWGLLTLLRGPIHRTPEWDALLVRLEETGRTDERVRLKALTRPGYLSGGENEESLFHKLRQREVPQKVEVDSALASTLPREQLFVQAASRLRKEAEQTRSALSALAQDPGKDVTELLVQQLTHESRRVRVHVHRLLRGRVDKARYLELSMAFLDDGDAQAQSSTIRLLSHGRHLPALPRLVELVLANATVVREAASEGLRLFGEDALVALQAAQRKARPDRRAAYQRLIDLIEEDLGPR